MMDNASALPTCPQRQQQEKTAFRKWPKITHTTSRRGIKKGDDDCHLMRQPLWQMTLTMVQLGFRRRSRRLSSGAAHRQRGLLEARLGLREAAAPADDPQAALVVRKGHEHEAACFAGLKERCGDFFEVPPGSLSSRFAATVDAMERGAPLIYQAALTAGSWLGYADFLVRVNDHSARWNCSYEPWDAKLARTARPEHVLQIALYGDLLGTVQGRAADQGCLMLGTGETEKPYNVESFSQQEFRSASPHSPYRNPFLVVSESRDHATIAPTGASRSAA